jgi:23S rRNA pseudouridine1911/1915/1917 synthase
VSSSPSYELIASEADAGLRVDHFLAARRLPLSRSQLKRHIDGGRCRVNGEPARPAKKLRAGDRVALEVLPPEPDRARPEAIALAVLYEDEQLIVIDKPAGLVVHPAAGHSSGTLVNALLGHCTALSGVGGTLRAGIVHRLDRDTSGVLVASKTDAAHLALAEQFAAHSVERRYLAVVAGAPPPEGTFDTRYGRHPTDRKRFTARRAGERARRAVTHWRVVEPLRGATLVEARLETGRTHQVRVHFAEAGHAVLGDLVYGRPPADRIAREAAQRLISRQALHAHALGFDHPASGERLRFATPPPADIEALIAELRAAGSERR